MMMIASEVSLTLPDECIDGKCIHPCHVLGVHVLPPLTSAGPEEPDVEPWCCGCTSRNRMPGRSCSIHLRWSFYEATFIVKRTNPTWQHASWCRSAGFSKGWPANLTASHVRPNTSSIGLTGALAQDLTGDNQTAIVPHIDTSWCFGSLFYESPYRIPIVLPWVLWNPAAFGMIYLKTTTMNVNFEDTPYTHIHSYAHI